MMPHDDAGCSEMGCAVQVRSDTGHAGAGRQARSRARGAQTVLQRQQRQQRQDDALFLSRPCTLSTLRLLIITTNHHFRHSVDHRAWRHRVVWSCEQTACVRVSS